MIVAWFQPLNPRCDLLVSSKFAAFTNGVKLCRYDPEVLGGTIVKKEVFMDMDVAPTTPR